MKKILRTTLLVGLMLVGLAGCRSAKKAADQPGRIAQPEVVETPKWENVTFPVRLNIIQPMGFALNGTATLVRDKYIYVSFRMLGFEIAQAYVSPEQMDLVMKQPQKMWIEEPMANRFKEHKLSFSVLQEALLGDVAVRDELPALLQCGGTETAPQFRLQTKMKGMQLDVVLECMLDDARWNVDRPATFSAPGGISKSTIQNAAALLGR